jgi:glycolate oxidase FAD binding subunit
LPSVSSVDEAAAVFRRAAAAGHRISIDREDGDVVLSTEGLDRVLEHEAGDLTATVEGGIRLSALNAYLADYGQMLALDPPGDPTVGACLAANLSGPRSHRYGAPRDLVLGVTVVLGDGTVAHSGGKVVKNVAGYDLARLFCGSRGSLGLIARASLRLHPRPAVAATLVAPVDGPDHAAELAQALHRSPLVTSAVDLHWPGQLALLFEGSDRAVAEQVTRACALVDGREADGSVWAESAQRQARARGRVSFAPSSLATVLGSLPEGLIRPLAGIGYLPEPTADERSEPLLLLTERIRAEFDPAGVLA